MTQILTEGMDVNALRLKKGCKSDVLLNLLVIPDL